MKLGFVTAILPEYSAEEVLGFAAEAGVLERRADVLAAGQGRASLCGGDAPRRDDCPDAIARVRDLSARTGVAISGLGYYPNPLVGRPGRVGRGGRAPAARSSTPRPSWASGSSTRSSAATRRCRSTPTGRGSSRSGGRWSATPRSKGVRIGIENCPMLFTDDEWPGGKNLATSPAIWRRMFADIPSPSFGLELRPVAPGLAADGLRRPLARVPRPAGPRPRQGRPDRPGGARRARRPGLPQALAHAQAPRPGRRPLGRLLRRALPTPATTGRSPSRSRTAPSRARSRPGATRWSSAAVTCTNSSSADPSHAEREARARRGPGPRPVGPDPRLQRGRERRPAPRRARRGARPAPAPLRADLRR